jgi:hypothetical protein
MGWGVSIPFFGCFERSGKAAHKYTIRLKKMCVYKSSGVCLQNYAQFLNSFTVCRSDADVLTSDFCSHS